MSIGLYIHIPFCIKKCKYCDFVSYPYDADLAASYVYALGKEMALKSKELGEEQKKATSIYVGGGTPTCLDGEQLAYILKCCRQNFAVQENAEITVECNPGTVNFDKLFILHEAGYNRISIGVQACQKKLLASLGRIHDWDQVKNTVAFSRRAGFKNISLDLIFGIPGQSIKDWLESLEMVTDLMPQHISAYNLKIEEGTPLFREVSSGITKVCDEELELEMYLHCIEYLENKGFRQYEISNFARPGMESRHNLLYWRNEEYLGFGTAAHSMMGDNRFSNVESVELYINSIKNDTSVIAEQLKLTSEDKLSEAAFLGLRLTEGINIDEFERKYGVRIEQVYAKQINKLKKLELLEIEENRLKLTKKGLPLANEAFVEFI